MQKCLTKIFLEAIRQKLSSVAQKNHFEPYGYAGERFAIRSFNLVKVQLGQLIQLATRFRACLVHILIKMPRTEKCNITHQDDALRSGP